MPGYDHKKQPLFNYEYIIEKYAIAKQRAMTLKKERESSGDIEGNPSTNIYEILDIVVENGKEHSK
jgi:hypothetical protein